MKAVLAIVGGVLAALVMVVTVAAAALTGAGGATGGGVTAGGAAAPVTATGWVRPTPGAIVSGFRTRDRPTHNGVDLAAPRDAIVRAAAAGTVVTVTCNASLNGGPYPCDRDGSDTVRGCGWYVEVRHPGDIVTRYCHLGHRPLVTVGQHVTAGTPLGQVGASGNASGPHLHFEVHTGYPAESRNAVNPVPFLATRGIPL